MSGNMTINVDGLMSGILGAVVGVLLIVVPLMVIENLNCLPTLLSRGFRFFGSLLHGVACLFRGACARFAGRAHAASAWRFRRDPNGPSARRPKGRPMRQ